MTAIMPPQRARDTHGKESTPKTASRYKEVTASSVAAALVLMTCPTGLEQELIITLHPPHLSGARMS